MTIEERSTSSEGNEAGSTAEQSIFDSSNFWTKNPWSNPKTTDANYVIQKPWGDQTLAIIVPKNHQDLPQILTDLDHIILPKEFSAIYHSDIRSLEIIFTAAPIEKDLKGRAFKLTFDGVTHECKFAESSERLLRLADNSRPVQSEGASSYRNLPIYTRYLAEKRRLSEGEEARYFPYSFWISDIDLNVERLVPLIRHLNYYMTYFDTESPLILIHQDVEAVKMNNPRYLSGSFPNEIKIRRIDETMIDLWEGTLVADPLVRFIRSFQVLEYAAFYYISSEVRDSVSQILLRPEAMSDVSTTIDRVLDSVVTQRLDDDSKIKEIVKKQTDISKLWKFIEANKEYFSSQHCFDGGFEIESLIKQKWDLDDFTTSCHPKLTENFIKIRNNLVHAREKRQSKALFHTNKNRLLLRPWASLIHLVALQVSSTK